MSAVRIECTFFRERFEDAQELVGAKAGRGSRDERRWGRKETQGVAAVVQRGR